MPSHGHTAPTPPTIAQVVDKVFTRFDANNNGSITSPELLAVVDADGTHTALAAQAKSLLASADTNADAALSKAEVTAVVTKLDTDADGLLERSDRSTDAAAAAFDLASVLLVRAHGDQNGSHGLGTPAKIADTVSAWITRFDGNSDGGVTLAEIIAKLDPAGTHTAQDAKVTALFPKLDGNGNGSVVAAELTTVLTALDSNADGALDRAEIHAAPDGSGIELIGVGHLLCGPDFGA